MEKYSSRFRKKWFSGLAPEKVKDLTERCLGFLSEEQAEVALHYLGPMMVIAGPGSGKTETMVRRAAILIDHFGVDPASLLLTTFTEKAAENLITRLRSVLKKPQLVEQITIGTIHSVCLKILEDFGVERGLFTRSLRVLDEHKGSLFLFKNFEEIGLTEYFDRPTSINISAMNSYYSSFQERGTDVEKLLEKIKDDDTIDANVSIAAKTFKQYKKEIDENQALDFATILSRTLEVLQCDKEVLAAVRTKYQFLLVDEYQDTNPLQDKILRLIAEPKNNIVVIGDDDQSLYRFRGATVKNFLDFPTRVPGCTTKHLNENRRSTSAILNISRKIVSGIPKQGRTEKSLVTQNPEGDAVTVTAYETDADEVAGIAQAIEDLHTSGKIKSYSDVAVLSYSLSSIYGQLKAELDARGIPFVAKGDKSFSGQPSILQIVELMNFCTRRKGSIQNLEAIAPPVFTFLDPNTADQLRCITSKQDIIDKITSMDDLKITSPYDRGRVFELIELRRKMLTTNYSKKTYTDLLDLFFQIIKIADTLKFHGLNDDNDESESILDQLGEFSQLLSDYSNETLRRSFSDFRDFFNYIIGNSLDTPRSESSEDAVIIQTIHSAKGLEYPVVFLPGLVDSRFPSRRADDSSGVPYYNGIHSYWDGNSQFESVDTDFRRILYVASTRAEKLLFYSYFKKKKNKAAPSRYIKELIDSHSLTVVSEPALPKKLLDLKHRRSTEKLRLSSSHLQYYLFCPTRFKFALKHNIAAPHRGYFSFGSNLHSAIEEASNIVRTKGSKALLAMNPETIFERHWNNFGFDALGAEERQKENARKYFNRFIKHQIGLLEKIQISEKKFTLEESNFILTGKIDAITSEGGNLIVIDFKTGKKDKFEKEPESTFVNHQANIYVEAVNRMTGNVPAGFKLHFLGEEQSDPKDFQKSFNVSTQSRKNVLNLLSETADRIKMKDFAPLEEKERIKRCSLCEFRDVCAYRLRSKEAA